MALGDAGLAKPLLSAMLRRLLALLALVALPALLALVALVALLLVTPER